MWNGFLVKKINVLDNTDNDDDDDAKGISITLLRKTDELKMIFMLQWFKLYSIIILSFIAFFPNLTLMLSKSPADICCK